MRLQASICLSNPLVMCMNTRHADRAPHRTCQLLAQEGHLGAQRTDLVLQPGHGGLQVAHMLHLADAAALGTLHRRHKSLFGSMRATAGAVHDARVGIQDSRAWATWADLSKELSESAAEALWQLCRSFWSLSFAPHPGLPSQQRANQLYAQVTDIRPVLYTARGTQAGTHPGGGVGAFMASFASRPLALCLTPRPIILALPGTRPSAHAPAGQALLPAFGAMRTVQVMQKPGSHVCHTCSCAMSRRIIPQAWHLAGVQGSAHHGACSCSG